MKTSNETQEHSATTLRMWDKRDNKMPERQKRGDSEETNTMINVASDADADYDPSSLFGSFTRGPSVGYKKREPKRAKSKLFIVGIAILVAIIVLIVAVILLTIFGVFRSGHKQDQEGLHFENVTTQVPETPFIDTEAPFFDNETPFIDTKTPLIDSEAFIPRQPPKETPKEQKYCSTKTCRDVANSITEAMDVYTDPCENFYQYACGGWIRHNSLSEGVTYLDHFFIRRVKNVLASHSLLEKYPKGRSTAEDKARIYYASCLDEDGVVEKLGSEPILTLLKEIGGWNISGNFDITSWDFQRTLEVLHNLPTATKPFSWAVGVDLKQSSKNIIQLFQGTLGLRDKVNYRIHDMSMMAVYLNYMVRIGVLLGGEEKSTKEQMLDVMFFEINLAYLISDEMENIELLYNKMTLSALMKMAPAIDWLQYFNFAFKDTNREILPSDEITVSSPKFIRQMSQLIDKYLSTTKGRIILSNYFGWSIVLGSIVYLPKSFQVRSITEESKSDSVEWLSCLQKVEETMGFAVGAMFVKDSFKSEIKHSVELMVNKIRDAFKQNLHWLNWLDEETKELIGDKIDAIAVSVGYPDFIMERGKLDTYYENLELRGNQYFDNTVRLQKFFIWKNTMELGEPVNRFEWKGLMPYAVNARTNFPRNQIVFPAGILMEPFYKTDYPKFLSFSRLGFLIGHEFMHIVDDTGRLFDKSGNLHSWWNKSTIQSFETHAKCFVDQYSNYQENLVHLNGSLTLSDNIADNGGLKIAFRAYENWMKSHSTELPLFHPALQNLSPQKLFFIGFAQTWCATSTPERLSKSLREDKHSPHKFRVIGTLANSDDFRREFNCPRTTSANSKKCELW